LEKLSWTGLGAKKGREERNMQVGGKEKRAGLIERGKKNISPLTMWPPRGGVALSIPGLA
jgi:hypothetical protein